MGIDNYESNEYAIIIVECPKETQNQHAFSNCANKCPLYPDSSIRIKSGASKICEGDVFYILKENVKFRVWKFWNLNRE